MPRILGMWFSLLALSHPSCPNWCFRTTSSTRIYSPVCNGTHYSTPEQLSPPLRLHLPSISKSNFTISKTFFLTRHSMRIKEIQIYDVHKQFLKQSLDTFFHSTIGANAKQSNKRNEGAKHEQRQIRPIVRSSTKRLP